ncbi:MAG: lamin tail domain-containing protein [Sandaracinus sp.]
MTRRSLGLLFSLLALGAVGGCAEARATRDAGRAEDAAMPVDAHASGDDAHVALPDGGPTPGGGLVVNEIAATGSEFVELLNTGASPVDLSALRFTDDDMGAPNTGHLTPIPDGVVLHTGERLVIVTNVTGATGELATGADCGIAGVDECFPVSFGISNSNGDGAYVLASDDSVVASALYPAMAVGDTQSFCRLPDGSGALTACTPTPGAVNAP